MEDAATLITGIEYKVRKLVDNIERLSSENIRLLNKNRDLENKIEENIKIIKTIEDKNKTLIVAKSLEFSEGSINAKKRIDELVREIDMCINLLNK